MSTFPFTASTSSSSSDESTKLHIPPAAELFADSYDHALLNTMIYIFILKPTQTASNQVFGQNAIYLTEALEKCGYDPNKIKRIRFNKIDDLKEFLNGVKTMDFFDCTALLLFWFGETDENESNGMIALMKEPMDIRDLWKPFVQEEQLMGKPKINMFFTYVPLPSSISVDSSTDVKIPRDPYETPEEADVLIMYQKTDRKKQKDDSSFVKSFANNMIKWGRQYHICNLAFIDTVMDPEHGLHYPIVVSTLTSKFFIQASQHRGIHLELDDLTNGIKLNLTNMLYGGRAVQLQLQLSTYATIVQKWKKRAGDVRRSTNTAPPTPRRQSKDTLLSDISSASQLGNRAVPFKFVPPATAQVPTRMQSIRKKQTSDAGQSTSAVVTQRRCSKDTPISDRSSAQHGTPGKPATCATRKATPSRSRLSSTSSTNQQKWHN